MKSWIRLDSAVFQLTPTRTRFDLVVSANGKTEKLASGLLNPFLAHLKTAEDQVAKGGYSIILQPESGDDATWFTKGTVERFVRFVSTPEVLERVYTIESEVLQIKEAITIQSKRDIGSTVVEENQQGKTAASIEGSRALLEPNDEKAIVLYQPDSHASQVNGSTVLEENSKVQVLKVLETRKTALQKEQGMAFARAMAAGFDIDDMAALISFSKSFGASRLMDACVKFIDLWKKKHESGQWVEIQTMSVQPDVSAMNESGIVLSNAVNLQRDSWPGTPENYGKANLDGTPDAKSPTDNKPNTHKEYLQGQFPHPMFPPWPVHSPPGAFPVFQGYPMQGMPYHPSYSGNSPYQSPYQTAEDPSSNSGQRKMQKYRTSDSDDSRSEKEETDKVRSGRRKKSGKVVIRNINYITSKKQNFSGNDSGTESDAESHEEGMQKGYSNDKERTMEATEVENGHWQAFQNYLLKDADSEEHAVDYEMEMQVRAKKRPNAGGCDPLVYHERGMGQYQEGNIADMQNGNITCKLRGSNDEFIIRKGENHPRFRNSSDPLTVNGFEHSSSGLVKRASYNMDDDSYIVSLRSVSANEVGISDRKAIDIGSEIPSWQSKEEKLSRQINYEPDDLSLMPERGTEKISTGYDPALEHELQARASVNKKNEVAFRGTKKSEKDPRSSLSSDKVKVSGPIRKGRPTKLSPLDEARVRAEKLRTYKADLQKRKKEKEEEEKKRIEALKMARQKRIAARSNSGVAQSTLPSQKTRKQLPTKLSPSAHRGSKFSDSEPGSTSPLQRFSIRTASLGYSDSQKLSKPSKLITWNNSAGNRLTRSASSLPDPKKQSNIAPETKPSISRIRRLSEPKLSSNTPVSSVRTRGPVSSKRVSDGPERKKISAMMNHDKTKIASLPELKLRTSKGLVDAHAKEMVKANENKSSKSKVETNMDGEKVSCQSNGDEIPVLEKTVVMLEEKPTIPAAHKPSQNHNTSKTPDLVSEYATIHAPISPLTMEEVDKKPVEQQLHENSSGNDLVLVRLENLSDSITETPKFPTIQNLAEKPHQAPYARLSSLEDSCTQNSEYSRVPSASMQIHEVEPETVKAHVSAGTKLEKIPETLDKSQTKESSKGLRKLLKFGRKTQSLGTGEHIVDLNNMGVNGSEVNKPAANTATSSEVYTLKNLISQDETPIAAAAPHKSSRHFSILSPFKSKTAEKKMTS